MKFLADMGLSQSTVNWLREQGHDAVHLGEQGLEQMPDVHILSKAKTENRVLLTHDLDFAELLAISGGTLPSVVLFRLKNMTPSHVNAYLTKIITEHGAALEQGAFLSINERRVRQRLLPIKGIPNRF